MSRDGARAYVTSPEGHFVSVVDARARRVLKRIAVGGQPFGVAVSPDGRRLYVADMNGRELLEIDPDSEKTRRVEIGAMPSGVAATPDGRLVIAAARDDNALVVIDAETFARVATIAVGRHPYGVTIDAQGRRAYTANVESDDVSVIDLAERKLIATRARWQPSLWRRLGQGPRLRRQSIRRDRQRLRHGDLRAAGDDQGRRISRKRGR